MGSILVVEDEPDMRELMAVKLRGAGHRVRTAQTGVDGLASLREDRPDLVLLDVQLPDTTGLAFCKTVRADAEIRDILIVMISASASQEEVDAGLAAGADDYVTKPFAPSALVARIQALLDSGPA
ncbi:response regulator transcription factor [Cryptosporangium phraense]|uniref:response regulator transcription factor n=1 Tax=Cryptosporangium phraense TaxID=2593070 RepID=UPI00147926B3|nr:response regulator [Cryptosporangium phraense]